MTPRTPLETQIVTVWEKLLAPLPVSVQDDFFYDLGGHSLLVARMVSELRQTPPFRHLSVLDVYQHPTAEELAAQFERRQPTSPVGTHSTASPKSLSECGTRWNASLPAEVPFWRHFFCGSAQLVSLFFILSFFALQWIAPYLTYTILVEEEYDFVTAVLGSFASLIVFYPVMLAIPILVKWIVIGRYRAGAYPLWGTYYFRWWFATTIEAAVPVGYLRGTPLLNIYLRLMGARIGPNVHLDGDAFSIYDLLSIGEDSSVNADSTLLGYTIEDGQLKIGAVTIGKRCFVGARASVGVDAVMQDDSALEDLSLLPPGGVIPRGETWLGSPARKVGQASRLPREPKVAESTRPATSRRFAFGLLHAIGLLTFPVLVVSALFPGIVVMNKLNYLDPYYWYLLLAPLVGLSFVTLLALEIAAVKWLLLGKVKPGRTRSTASTTSANGSWIRRWI